MLWNYFESNRPNIHVDYHIRCGFKRIVHHQFRSSTQEEGQLLVKVQSGQASNSIESKSGAVCRVSAPVVRQTCFCLLRHNN